MYVLCLAQARFEVVASLFVLELGALLYFARTICSSYFINYFFFCCYIMNLKKVSSIPTKLDYVC
jgi:hypothetical protein